MSPWKWSPYVPVAQRRAKAAQEMDKLCRQNQCVLPVRIEGRAIARSFWGKSWCDHLESFSDYANRLPRGRTYVRNGAVCHLEIRTGVILAMVSGSKLYSVRIAIAKLPPVKWQAIINHCTGQIGSLLELLQGKFSTEVMTVVADRTNGLFPLPGEITLDCSCPDWADMCKHVAAVLYGVGHRLDTDPGLLFTLRGVDAQELISAPLPMLDDAPRPDALADVDLADLFGIAIELEATEADPVGTRPTPPATTIPQQGAASPATARKMRASTASATQKPTSRPGHPKSAPKPFRPTGANIRKLRLHLKLSVDDFATCIGASPATVRRWEDTRGICTVQARFKDALQTLHESGL